MIAETELRTQLTAFLAGEMPAEGFWEWFALQSWNLHKDSTEAAQKLAYAIELRFAEHSAGHLTADDLVRELGLLAGLYTVRVSFAEGQMPAFVSSFLGALKNSPTSSSPQKLLFAL